MAVPGGGGGGVSVGAMGAKGVGVGVAFASAVANGTEATGAPASTLPSVVHAPAINTIRTSKPIAIAGQGELVHSVLDFFILLKTPRSIEKFLKLRCPTAQIAILTDRLQDTCHGTCLSSIRWIHFLAAAESSTGCSASGSSSVNFAPPSGEFSTQIRPPMASVSERTIERPTPSSPIPGMFLRVG